MTVRAKKTVYTPKFKKDHSPSLRLWFYTLAVLFLCFSNCFGQTPEKWKYRCGISVEDSSKKFAQFDITPEIYDKSQKHLNDLRLINSDNQQVPYALISPWKHTQKNIYQPDIINRATNDENCSFVTLDLGERKIKNYIEVDTLGSNFRREVKIEGSNNNTDFLTIVEQAFVFSVEKKYVSEFSGINMPPNDYKYLRVTVFPMEGDIKNPEIKEIRIYKCEKDITDPLTIEPELNRTFENEKEKTTVYTYDLGHKNLPIDTITFNVKDDSFYRYVEIEARNDITQIVELDGEDNKILYKEIEANWIRTGSAAIYRYDSETDKTENLKIKLSPESAKYRYLRITVRNYDDLPLIIKGVSVQIIPEKVIFETNTAVSTMLYTGAEKISRPHYDLEKQISNSGKLDAAVAKLSVLEENPEFVAEADIVPWSENFKNVPMIIIIILVAILGYIIVKSFEKIKKEDTVNTK
ncbi:MAG: DUF3999 family protein [Sedimentisphaeraceae bacterium JB056]